MWWIIGIIAAFYIIRTISRVNAERFVRSRRAFQVVPGEIKTLIEYEAAGELAELLVQLEVNGRVEEVCTILDAINSKGLRFATRVDRIRSPLREAAGLGPLRMFK